MDYGEKLQVYIPNERTEILMKECGYKDCSKFLDDSLSIIEWLVSHKRQGMCVGAFTHENKRYSKMYHPMLETVSAKASED